MKSRSVKMTIWALLMSACLGVLPAFSYGGYTYFNDGGTHNIDYLISPHVYVDYEAPGMQTTVNLLAGGSVGQGSGWNLYGYNDCHINVSGGAIGGYLYAFDNSQVDISGGWIGEGLEALDNSQVVFSGGTIGRELHAHGSSQVDISGGTIDFHLYTYDNSQVNISGGTIGSSYLLVENSSVLSIEGSDFAVDGQLFGYGELSSIYGGSWLDEGWRRLTGTLASGGTIDNDFAIGHDASIVLIPEPATLLLLGLGGLALLRNRRFR